jgi:RNA polymerase sigma-70 factor (sigma-E family)
MDRLIGPQPRTLRSVRSAEPADTGVDVLFRQHYAALLRIAYALLGTREGAEDAVQDAFVSLYRHWNRLRDHGAADAYLRSAVMNRCRSGIRSLVRDRALTELHVVPLHTEGSDATAVVNDDARLVGLALRKLPQRQREVVACRYLLELSVAETAETLGISDGSVKRHAHRGLHALHTALEVTR